MRLQAPPSDDKSRIAAVERGQIDVASAWTFTVGDALAAVRSAAPSMARGSPFASRWMRLFKAPSVAMESTIIANEAEPWFTIAISVYDRAGMIRRCISSCLDQSFSDFEIV